MIIGCQRSMRARTLPPRRSICLRKHRFNRRQGVSCEPVVYVDVGFSVRSGYALFDQGCTRFAGLSIDFLRFVVGLKRLHCFLVFSSWLQREAGGAETRIRSAAFNAICSLTGGRASQELKTWVTRQDAICFNRRQRNLGFVMKRRAVFEADIWARLSQKGNVLGFVAFGSLGDYSCRLLKRVVAQISDDAGVIGSGWNQPVTFPKTQ